MIANILQGKLFYKIIDLINKFFHNRKRLHKPLAASINRFNLTHCLLTFHKIFTMQEKRRSVIKKLFGSLVAVTGFGFAAKASTNIIDEKKSGNIEYDQDIPLFSGHTILGNTVFIAGKG